MTFFTIEKLYHDYKVKIHIMSFRIMGNKDNAEDITLTEFSIMHLSMSKKETNPNIGAINSG